MSEAVIALYRNKGLAEEYGKKGRAYAVKNLSREAILKEFEKKIVEVASQDNK